MLSEKYEQALCLAADLHRTQTRKSTDIPYLSHLMAVSSMVIEACDQVPEFDCEDLAIAALLHDTLEDQGHKKPGRQDLRRLLRCSDRARRSRKVALETAQAGLHRQDCQQEPGNPAGVLRRQTARDNQTASKRYWRRFLASSGWRSFQTMLIGLLPSWRT